MRQRLLTVVEWQLAVAIGQLSDRGLAFSYALKAPSVRRACVFPSSYTVGLSQDTALTRGRWCCIGVHVVRSVDADHDSSGCQLQGSDGVDAGAHGSSSGRLGQVWSVLEQTIASATGEFGLHVDDESIVACWI